MTHHPSPELMRPMSTAKTGDDRRTRLEARRTTAKWGMVAAMGALVVTGYIRRSPQARLLHVLAGGALLGLSYWHQTLYVSDPRRRL